MPFDAGRISFCRLLVEGDAPSQADDALLERLARHGFTDSTGAPAPVEAGWTAGEHLFDQQFTYEKNNFTDRVFFGLRIDTHRVPSDLRQAYLRVHEQAMAADSPSGFVHRQQRQAARAEAQAQLDGELAAGKHRRSKHVQALWDLRQRTVYVSANGSSVLEQLAGQFRNTFELRLVLASAGVLAERIVTAGDRSRDLEDLRPSPFTAPPDAAHSPADEADGSTAAIADASIPSVPWAHGAADPRDFLGNEFLLWLWWTTQTGDGAVALTRGDGRKAELAVVFDRLLDMDCAWGAGGKQSLRGGGPTRMPEARQALRQGKWPRRAGLILSDGDHQWDLSLQADRWQVSGAVLPEGEGLESSRQVMEHRLEQLGGLSSALDDLFAHFLRLRCGRQWTNVRDEIRGWIRPRR